MSDMKRRAFIALLGGAAAWPLAARAQQLAIGYLHQGASEPNQGLVATFLGRTTQAGDSGLKPGSKTSPNVLSRKARPCAGPQRSLVIFSTF
jgi:hypothetical protein